MTDPLEPLLVFVCFRECSVLGTLVLFFCCCVCAYRLGLNFSELDRHLNLAVLLLDFCSMDF